MLSQELERIAQEAFFKHLLPEIKARLPEVEEKIAVNVTSSVAYGVADKLSDLDLFIIFKKQRDYSKYSKRLEDIINSTAFPEHYKDACHWGVKFEIESLQGSDMSRLFYHPQNKIAWLIQTDWLMYWLLNSRTIYDPGKINERFHKKYSFYPDGVLTFKENTIRLGVIKHCHELEQYLKNGSSAYVVLNRLFRFFNKILDLLWLRNNSYPPHPKWKYFLACKKLKNPEDNKLLQSIENIISSFGELYNNPDEFIRRIGFIKTSAIKDSLYEDKQEKWEEYLLDNSFQFYRNGRRIYMLFDYFIDNPKFNRIQSAIRNNRQIYLPDETGVYFLLMQKYNYDIAQRISDRARFFLMEFDNSLDIPSFKVRESRAIRIKRYRYSNFVIWRKIRVINKSIKRGHYFNRFWYTIQVIEHFIEILSRINNRYLPPDDFLDDRFVRSITLNNAGLHQILGDLIFGKDLHHTISKNGEQLIDTFWNMLNIIQDNLVSGNLLPGACVDDSSEAQSGIEYWKYENIFL